MGGLAASRWAARPTQAKYRMESQPWAGQVGFIELLGRRESRCSSAAAQPAGNGARVELVLLAKAGLKMAFL